MGALPSPAEGFLDAADLTLLCYLAASSGIMPDPECANIWAALLKNKPYGDKKIRGYIFKVNETKTAIVPDVEIIRTESREEDWGIFENHIQNMPKVHDTP